MQDTLPPRADRGHVSFPRRVDGLALALRLCVDREQGSCLAQLVKPVPADYVGRASRLSDRHEISIVACPCGASADVNGRLRECPGGCGRWMAADAHGAWSVRL
jgi:hypothetical protein